jgi:hypothetical protein
VEVLLFEANRTSTRIIYLHHLANFAIGGDTVTRVEMLFNDTLAKSIDDIADWFNQYQVESIELWINGIVKQASHKISG